MSEIAALIALPIALLSFAASVWIALIERGRDVRAAEHERRTEAAKVQAYVATRLDVEPEPGRKVPWGIVILNAGTTSLTNLVVWTRAANDPLTAELGRLPSAGKFITVPPGQYYIERTPSSEYAWAFPRIVDTSITLQPIMNSAGWLVERFEFADANGQCWRRTYDAQAVETGELEPIESSQLSKADAYRRRPRANERDDHSAAN